MFAVKSTLSASDLARLSPELRRVAEAEAAVVLQTESATLTKIGHGCPSIITFFGTSQHGLVFEYASRGDLCAYLNTLRRVSQRPLNVDEAAVLLLAMVQALTFLHGRRIVHGDIK